MNHSNNSLDQDQDSETSVKVAPKLPSRETKSGITYFEATEEQLKASRILQDIPAHTTLLSGPQVAQRLGVELNDLIEMCVEDDFPIFPGFPDAVEFVPGMCRWLEHEVDRYINRQIYHRNPGVASKVTDWKKFSDALL